MKLIIDMWDDGWLGRTVIMLMVSIFLLVPIVIYGSIKEAEAWEEFSSTHACKKIGYMSGSVQTGVGVGIMTNGQIGAVVTTNNIHSKTAWFCNDGITYWR